MPDSIPKSRSYVHLRCGNVTEVGGGDFSNVASPLPGTTRTMCAACGEGFPIAEFQWEDTGEGISGYYDRYRANIGSFTRVWCSRALGYGLTLIGFLLGILFGWWVADALGVVWGVLLGLFACLAGAIAGVAVWSEVAHRKLASELGVADVRCLR